MNSKAISEHIALHWLPIMPEGGARHEREEKTISDIISAVFGPGCRRLHNDCGAPYVVDNEGHPIHISISVSHSRTIGAVCTAPQGCLLGMDVEEERPQLARVAQRVMSPQEYAHYSTLPHGLLRAWTMKEALYKAARTALGSEVDFTTQLCLPLPGCRARVLRPDGTVLAHFDVYEHRLTADTLCSVCFSPL